MTFNNFFDPKSVALIGASDTKGKLGNDILLNLKKSNITVFPVNPNHEKIEGIKCYRNLDEIKEEVDLVIVATPAATVPGVIRECGERGVKNAVIISAGFLEAGNKELDSELKKAVEESGVSMVGPNCLGVINGANGFNGSFYSGFPKGGKIAFISQSGALGVAILDIMIQKGIGLSKFVSIGNALNISFTELIDYLAKDNETEVICVYAEYIKDARKFLEHAKGIGKKIIVLKAGRSEKGAEAAKTHTSALAVPDKIFDGAFKQFGLHRVDTIEQLLECAELVVNKNVTKGRRGLVITNAGGAGVLGADSASKYGIELAEVPAEIVKDLDKKMPFNWSRQNPIDVVGDAKPDRYRNVLEAIAPYSFYDFVFLILTPQTMSEPEGVAEVLIEFWNKRRVPCYSCLMGGNLVEKAKNILREKGIANFEEPEKGFALISKMVI